MNGKRVYLLTDEQVASLRRSGGMGIHESDAIAALQQDVRCQTCRWWVPRMPRADRGLCQFSTTRLAPWTTTTPDHACIMWEAKDA